MRRTIFVSAALVVFVFCSSCAPTRAELESTAKYYIHDFVRCYNNHITRSRMLPQFATNIPILEMDCWREKQNMLYHYRQVNGISPQAAESEYLQIVARLDEARALKRPKDIWEMGEPEVPVIFK